MPDEKTAQIKPDQLKVLTENVPADGVSPHQIALTVVDEFGNSIPGYTVKSTADHGAIMAQEGQTDANGQLTVSLTNTQAGVTTVTLDVGGREYPVKVTFMPDEKTAQIKLDQLKVLTENVPADNVSPHQIALMVVDEFGNPIPGYTVKSTADHGAAMAQEGQTDANGQLTVSLTNTQAGVTTVTLDVGGRKYPVKVTFMPDEKTAQIKLDQLKVLTENVPADNVSPHQIALTVVDGFDNPIPDYTVKSIADHGAKMAQEGQTDANGQLTVSLTNTQAGVTTVTLDVGGREYPVKVTFMPDEKTAQIKLDQLKVLTKDVPADGVSPHQIALMVVDEFGNPIPGYTVKSTADHGGVMAQEGQTGANGQLTVSLTNTQAGVTTVTLEVGGQEYPVEVTFVPDEKTAQIAEGNLQVIHPDGSIAKKDDKFIADGETKYRVRAIVTDKSGNLLPDAEVTFQADNQAKITSETLKTDKAGKVEGSISSTKSGATMVTATINRSTGTVQSELSMLFIGNNMTANVVKVELDASKNKPDSAGKYIADGQTPVTLKALVVDKHGNALPSITVSWASDRDKNSVAFGNAQSETDENGAAVTTITSKKAFDVKVTAIAKKGSKISSNTSEPIQFKADLSTGKLSAITPSKSEALIADDKDSVELVSQLLDGHGNPLKGEKVVWSVDKSRAVINQTSTTDENGYARTILRTTQAGAIAVTANYGDSNNDQSITINAQADLKTAKVVLTSEKNVAVADGQELIKIIATVVDANNNPLVGRNITWNSPGSNPLTPFEGLIDAQGKSSTEISSTRAGEKVIEARLTDKIKATHTVTFTAISPDSAQADAEGMKAQGSFTLSPQSIVANGATKSEATLILKDQHGNLIPGQNDKIKYSVVSGDAGSITFHNQKESAIGTYNVTIPSGTKEGTVVIRAKITEQLYFDTTLKLLADEATKQLADVTMMKGIKAVTPKSGLRLKRSPITVNADGQDSVVIQAQLQDNNGNKSLPGINVSWKTSLGELSSISSQTDANGIAEVTLTSTQTGDAQVTAILATKEKTAPTQAHFMAGALSAAHSLVTISKNVAVAGEDVQITFTPKDRYGNTLTEPVENLTLAFTNNLGIRSGSPVFKPNNAGSYIATIQGTKAGQTDITVNVDSLRIDQSVKLEIVANRAKPQATDETNPFTLSKKGVDGVLKGSDSVTVGETVIYSISLTDENGNPLDKDIQTDWFIEGKGSLNATRVLTDNNGIARVELSSKETGTAKVTVNLPGGKSYTQNTVFTPGKLNTAMSEVTLSKSSIIADGKDTTTLTAKLYDTLKNAIPNQSTRINVTAPEASGVNISSQVIENKARPGEYTISINGTKSGEVKFTVFVDSAELLNKPVLKLIGDSRTKKMTAFTVSQNPVQAGNSVTYSLKVIDANNNPLEDIMVSWRLPSNMVDDNTPKPKSTSQTNELGIAEINLTPLKIGKFTLEASLDGQKYEKMPELTVTPSSVDRQKSTFTTNLEKIEAGDELQEAILTVTLLDKYDNPISGQQVNVGLVNKLGGVKVGAVKDHGDGTYTAPVTLGSHSGIAEFHATADEQKIGDTLSIKVEKMIPKLNFSHKKVRATYTKNYPQSQKVLNSPAGARQIWSSSAPDVAKVDSQGNVTLLKAGNTTITVETESTEQYKMASASYQLNVKRANPLLKSQNAQISAEWNDGITYSVIPEIGNPDANNDDFLEMAQFSSSDNNVVKVDKNGKLQAVKPGTATIMIKTPRTEQFRKSTATVRYQLKKGKVKIEFGRNIIRGSIHDEDIKLLQQNPSSPIPPDVKLKTKSSAHSVISISDDSSMSNNWQVKSVGTTTITQYISGNDYYNDSKGSYKVDIYGVPEIVAPSIKVTNAGEESGNKDWIPVFEDDVISVSWSLGKHTNDYDKAALVTVQLIEEGGRLLDEDKYIVSRLRPSGLMKTSFYPEKSYWGKKAFIRFRVDGFASTVNQTEMSSFYIKNLKPHEIWKSFGVQTHIIKEHEPGKGYTGRLGFAKGPIKSLRYLLKQNKMIFGSSRKLISPMDISIEAVSITDVLSFRSDNTKKFTIQGDRTDDFENNEANRWDLNYSNNQWPTGGRGSRGYELSVEIKYNDHVYKYRGTKQHVYNSGTAGMTTQFTDDKWELIQ
ncbi:putative invasin [Xenorhabdus mauleonii]|uniref:Intimin n=1 Tax=Xenorhabdus mauleonii TaxID=351675 RepID=A0A2G0NVN0_9GAMM|nr:Ig-like domain-containing protein [Xenorhabdus mauleonii]PHM38719.1 putative invasin [Xenorhabdus mauleonii]